MADTTYYVDTDVVGGAADGSSWANAFATLSAAEALNLNLTTGATDGVCTINCRGTAADTTAVTWNGWTTDAGGYVNIVGDFSGTAWSTSKYRLSVADANALTISDDYVRVSNLQVEVTGVTNGTDRRAIDVNTITATNNLIVFDSLYVRGVAADTDGLRGISLSDTDIVARIYNCIITNMADVTDTASIGIYVDGTTVDVYNCTIQGCAVGIARTSSTLNVYNSAVFNNGNDFSGTITLTTCASDDDDVGAQVAHDADWADDFTNVSTGDFSIKLGSQLIGTATPAPLVFTDDITGMTRGTVWDVGADQYATTGGSTAVIAAIMRRRRG